MVKSSYKIILQTFYSSRFSRSPWLAHVSKAAVICSLVCYKHSVIAGQTGQMWTATYLIFRVFLHTHGTCFMWVRARGSILTHQERPSISVWNSLFALKLHSHNSVTSDCAVLKCRGRTSRLPLMFTTSQGCEFAVNSQFKIVMRL